MTKTRILIVDDHQIVREGVRSLITTMRPGWTISEAGDGSQAIKLVHDDKPDLLIMDITMPGSSGFDVVTRLRKSGFDRPILMFTMHKAERLGAETREAGAQGYVLKSQAVEDLIRALDTLLAGGTFFGEPPTVKQKKGYPGMGLVFFSVLRSALG